MTQTYLSLRFEQIENRFSEIDLLLELAKKYQTDGKTYQALCRSSHVLLVSHFEGLYKEVCRDIIDDINANTIFYQVKKDIAFTHCDFFIHQKDNLKSTHATRLKLVDAFKVHPSNLRIEPFLFVDNKNPVPTIIETILRRFGVSDFFWSLEGSELDVVFEDLKRDTRRLREKLLRHLKRGTQKYPYAVDSSIYRPIKREKQKNSKTFYEDFLNTFLKGRHNIVHGHILDNPYNDEAIKEAKIKIEVLLYSYIINLCSAANPIFFLSEPPVENPDSELFSFDETVNNPDNELKEQFQLPQKF